VPGAARTDPVTVVVVDDNAIFRQAICRILSRDGRVTVVGVADSGAQGLAYAKERLPAVLLVDLRMPSMRGAELTAEVKQAVPAVEVVVLTVSDDQEDLLEALRAGARGYVLKSAAQSETVPAILAAAHGESWLSPKMAGMLIDEFTRLPSTVVRTALKDQAYLTPREQSLLSRLAQGMTNREIAQAMNIAETTVKTHLKNILEKLHARNRLEAAAIALRLGLTEFPEPERRKARHRVPVDR
jgi:DNA-binding NarL/FixJ family response regulator